jgi:hypothetical protein
MTTDNLGGTNTDTNTTVPPADTSGVLDGFFAGTMSPMVRIEHSVSPQTHEKMLMNVLIIIGVLAGLKLAQMVIFKAMQK